MGCFKLMRKRVLVIDDNPDMTELISTLLIPEHYDVFTTNQALQGINLVREIRPDVVILDLMMPDMHGLQVCQEIRKFSSVPLLVLSADSTPGLSTRLLDEGADDFLLKPMNPNILVAQTNRLARRSRQAAALT
jgi:two-component system KDP operon response regulator KdpE